MDATGIELEGSIWRIIEVVSQLKQSFSPVEFEKAYSFINFDRVVDNFMKKFGRLFGVGSYDIKLLLAIIFTRLCCNINTMFFIHDSSNKKVAY